MKTLFAITLVLNLLVELMAAATLIAGPGGISAAGTGNQWSMHYGFAVLAIASISVWIWPYRNNYKAVTSVLGFLLTFHTGLCASLVVAGDQLAGSVIHAVLALLCLICFTQRIRFCTE